MKRAALMMVGLLAVSGCASAQPHLNRGTVMEKEYSPAHYEKIGKCKSWVKGKPKTNVNCSSWEYHSDWHDACYELEIQGEGGREEDICVSRVVYDSYKVGDQWHG